MPPIPDVPDHATHDLALVAAYAAGDATGADLETATALVAGCAECAALHHDLRAIAAALPELPAPVRPRDFRLTPAQAASLRPAGWRRLLGLFAGPRFRLAAPLGTGLAALGLAGLFVGTLSGLPLGAGGAASAASPASVDARPGAAAQELATAAPQATAAPSAMDELAGRATGSESPAARSAPFASLAPGAALAPVTNTGPTPDGLPDGLPDVAMADSGPTIPVATLVSAVAVVAGLALLAARLLGRRLTRAP